MDNLQKTHIPNSRYREDVKIFHVKRYLDSGIGYKKYAHMNGIPHNTLYRWILKYKDLFANDNMSFEPVQCTIGESKKDTIELPIEEYRELESIKTKYNIIHSIFKNV
ncbi:MAG: transposase [Lachnospiraceae bacterium]|nr:transposase [Lachnospiraceae bacterium]